MNRRELWKLALIACMLAAAVAVYAWVGRMQDRTETETVRSAVREAALTCYAVEGAYPEDVEYLREHYRLAYDTERYHVTYDAFASNLIPDIWVTVKG